MYHLDVSVVNTPWEICLRCGNAVRSSVFALCCVLRYNPVCCDPVTVGIACVSLEEACRRVEISGARKKGPKQATSPELQVDKEASEHH